MRVSYDTECLCVEGFDAKVRDNGLLEAQVLLQRVKVIEVAKDKHKTSIILDTIILQLIPGGDGDNKGASIRREIFINIGCLILSIN